MNCYCCELKLKIARKVKLRSGAHRSFNPSMGGPDSLAYKRYVEDMTYRWAFICNQCYRTLDNQFGLDEIAGRPYGIAGVSRGDKAAVVDEAKYERFQSEQAKNMGIAYPDHIS